MLISGLVLLCVDPHVPDSSWQKTTMVDLFGSIYGGWLTSSSRSCGHSSLAPILQDLIIGRGEGTVPIFVLQNFCEECKSVTFSSGL